MRGKRRGVDTGIENPTNADEWFADYLRRCALPAKARRVYLDWIPQPQDAALARERAYDAETADLIRRIHHGSRTPVPGVTAPVTKENIYARAEDVPA